jgi:hypothetical protein
MALIGLSGLLAWLDFHGFLAQELEFLGAKALVARYGPEPRMQAIGFVFPPLPVYGTLAVASPITLHVLVGGLLVGVLGRSLCQVPVAGAWRWCWIALLLAHPALACMLLLSPSWIVATLLLMLCMARLLELTGPQPTPLSASLPMGSSLVLVGLALAPLMLVRHEAWSLVPWLGGIVWLISRREPWRFQLAALVLCLFLSAVFIAVWLYVNWLFTGDAWFFLHSAYSGWYIPGTESLIQQRGFVASWRHALAWTTVVVPVYGAVAVWLVLAARRPGATALMLALPVILIAAAFWQGSFTPELSRFGPALGVLPVLLRQRPPTRRWQRLGVTALLVLSLVSSGRLLQQGRFVPEETFLWRLLTHQGVPPETPEGRWAAQQEAKRQVARLLSERMRRGQRVLMDDVSNFSVVYLVNDPRYFIMPYQYEFTPALQSPGLFADFLLVAGPSSPMQEGDRVLQFWPQLEESSLSGFTPVMQTPYHRLFQRLRLP